MNISFKYKFILSFVTVEIIFISLIVFFNFSSLNHLSDSLTKEKIETSSKLFTEIIKTSLLIHDLATLDNAVENFVNIDNVMAVRILDSKHRLISHIHHNGYKHEDFFKKNTFESTIGGRVFRLKILPVSIESEVIGNLSIIYETTRSFKAIENNRNLTYTLILVEILLSILIAYIIGFRLTRSLSLLTYQQNKLLKMIKSLFQALKIVQLK